MTDQMPANFGWRYIGWFIWSNVITGLAIFQGAIATLLVATDPLDPHPLIPHSTLRVIVLVNAVLTGIVAQVKKNNPPGPPPTLPKAEPQE